MKVKILEYQNDPNFDKSSYLGKEMFLDIERLAEDRTFSQV